MTQKITIAKKKAPAKALKGHPVQKTVDANKTKRIIPKAPTKEEIQDNEWMNWVEYAQSRIRYLENKLALANTTIEEQKANILRLNKRVLQG
jgi:hypothetical protein